eukprot:TRINITY_DN1364_c0_g1_i3.p1 TRINITY_DN1364_c0_g1~~TRINITY_DN1364_c0_g1_i3.p1  ORF type:complete len:412 (+),score=75.05 TRINITY_DN1364_c0_g1_i3:970-2205(+)
MITCSVVSSIFNEQLSMAIFSVICVKLGFVLEIEPVPILFSLIIFSNIGSTFFSIGNTPFLIIKEHLKVDTTPSEYITHILPGAIFSIIPVIIYIWKLYKMDMYRTPIHGIREELHAWSKLIKKFDEISASTEIIQDKAVQSRITNLQKKQLDLTSSIRVKHAKSVTGVSLSELEYKYDHPLHEYGDENSSPTFKVQFIIYTLSLLGIMLLYVIHPFFLYHVSSIWISLFCIVLYSIYYYVNDDETIDDIIPFRGLLMYAGLSVFFNCINKLNVFNWVSENLQSSLSTVENDDSRLALTIFAIIWICSIFSSLFTNQMFLSVFAPSLVSLSTNLNLPLNPLIWSCVFGSSLGANGTLFGGLGNIIAYITSKHYGIQYNWRDYLKMSIPCTMLSLIFVTAYTLIFHVLVKWY